MNRARLGALLGVFAGVLLCLSACSTDYSRSYNRALDTFASGEYAEAAQAFQAVAKRQNKTLSVDVQPMLTLVGEEKSLVQLVSILLDNALKYSPEGGQIALRLSRQGKHLRLSVENTAEVLSKELLENMFDRFYRGDASRNSGQGGYGIGLSIAKAVVQAHRGKLSAAAKGTDRLVITALFPSA